MDEAVSIKVQLLRSTCHPYNKIMNELNQLKAELSQRFGRLTRFRRICAQRQSLTVEDQIEIAWEVLAMPISGSVTEARWEHLLLRRALDGVDGEPGVVEVPYTPTGY